MLEKIKRITILSLCFLSVFGTISSDVVIASGISNNNVEEKVLMVAIPDEEGNLVYYSGEQAQRIYEELDFYNEEDIYNPNDMDIGAIEEMDSSGDYELMGPFHYRYRFLRKSSGQKYGTSRRISNYLENRTSASQSMQISASTNITWNINLSLSGKFKEVFEAAVGGGWKQSSGFSQTLTMNVEPNRKVWLEFKPRLRYVSGECQKYYIPRGPGPKKEVIRERANIYSTSPISVTIRLAGKTFSAPDGAYVWKESKLK